MTSAWPRVRVALFASPLLAFSVASAAIAAETFTVRDTTIDKVADCKSLGEVLGESMVCIGGKNRAMNSARKQAQASGATDIVFTNVRCAFGAGERASARIFDCKGNVPIDLDVAYEDRLAADPKLAEKTVAAETPHLYATQQPDADFLDLERRAYLLVGYVAVNGRTIPPATITAKAKSVGAEVVLVSTKPGADRVEYQSVTRYSSGGAAVGFSTANVYGNGGSFNGTGTTVTALPGQTSTQMVPYAERTFDTQLLFFRKRRVGPFGLYLELVPAELRQSLGRNTGAYVVAVEDESPAFMADIVPGDILISADGAPIRTPADLGTSGSRNLVLLRSGAELTVQLSR